MVASLNVISSVNNIQFTLEEYGQEFTFTAVVDGTNMCGNAQLQLPTTPDSISKIILDDREIHSDQKNYNLIYDALRTKFYTSFPDEECAKASALLAKQVYAVEPVKNFYVAFSEGTTNILKEGYASGYYRVFYFDLAQPDDLFDCKEGDLIDQAKRSLSSSLKAQLKTHLTTELAAYNDKDSVRQASDELTNGFMKSKFHENYVDDGDFAQAFYENCACDIRIDAETNALNKFDDNGLERHHARVFSAPSLD